MKIFKYTISPDLLLLGAWQTVMAPSVFNIVGVNNQLGNLRIWAEVASELNNVEHRFCVVYTGDEKPDGGEHVGMAQFKDNVCHVYKKIR